VKDPLVLEKDAKIILSEVLIKLHSDSELIQKEIRTSIKKIQIELKTRYEPRSVKSRKNKGDHQNEFKQDYSTIINNYKTIRFIGFNPTNCTHSTFDYYVFDRQEFILHCFQITTIKKIEEKLTKCIGYFTKTNKELDEPFHNKWISFLIKLEDTFSSKKLKEKIYMVTEENKVNDYDSYFTGRKEKIGIELKQYFSKKLYEYLLQMNPGFSKILQSVKNLRFENYEQLIKIFSEIPDTDDDDGKKQLVTQLIKQETEIKKEITVFQTQKDRILSTLNNIKTLDIKTLANFYVKEFKDETN
jgi:hypothetical protein